MNINSKITMSITRFFKKYGKIILIVFIVWLIIFIINQQLKKMPKESNGTNTYTPDEAVMEENGNVPNKYRDIIKGTIDQYFAYCQNKDYESAFNMLTADCQEVIYNKSLNRFAEYISERINSQKKYYIQNYSNLKNIYIYDFYVIDDIEKTGGTGGFLETREKIALIKENNEFKISNQGYIGKEEINAIEEDENMVVKTISKDISYKKESYNIIITNKTDKYIIISDGTYTDSVTLNLGDQKRNATNTPNATFFIEPNSSKEMSFIFEKFADDGRTPTEINLNKVRIYDLFSNELKEEDADKVFSFNIKLNKK